MRCPLCEVSMKEVERRGVTIDICPECKGVWLDRGELDKLLEGESSYYEGQGRSDERYADSGRQTSGDRERDRGHGGHDSGSQHGFPQMPHGKGGHGKRKKKGFLGEMFDSFGEFGD